MIDDVYYEEELRYLREEGARFALLHPRRARHLNLGSVRGAHPRVERLMEGFAFLCARIRQRLDDNFPELTTGLAEMLWPRILQPIPGLCIVEFKPRAGMLQGSHTIKRGTAMYTAADTATGVSCKFATTRDLTVNPVTLDKVEFAATAAGKDTLTLTFKIGQGVRLETLRLSPLRIYIHDDLPSALLLRKTLLCNVCDAIVSDDAGQSARLDPRDTFAEGGVGEDDDLFPEPQNANRPLEMIRDYFTSPERFLFVDICGLDKLPRGDKPASTLSLKIGFDRKTPNMPTLTKENLRLYCVPAANVFKRDAEPVYVSGEKYEYRLVSDAARPKCYTILSVDSVTGVSPDTGARRVYERFGGPGSSQRSYSLRRNRLLCGEPEILLSMSGRQTEGGRLIRETLHIETWQSNGALARGAAGMGGLCKPAPNFPDFITFANITVPSSPINPPSDDKYLEAFLSHLSCAHTDFCDAEKLKRFLYAYNWAPKTPGADFGETRPEIESILSVSQKPVDLALDRAVIRGTDMRVVICERSITEETAFLFGATLARALSCMASINTFLKLTFEMNVSGKTFEWLFRGGEPCAI